MVPTNIASVNVPGFGTGRTGAAAGTGGFKPVDKETAAARKVARDFESLFVGMMLKSMRETVGKDKLTSGGHGEDVYRSLLDQEYARAISQNGGVGLSAMLELQLVKPVPDGAGTQGMNAHDSSNESTKTEVTYENR